MRVFEFDGTVYVFKIKLPYQSMSLSPGDRCPECINKNRRKVGDLEIDMSTNLFVCSHCMSKFRADGTIVR